jgi:hypothetical protein
LPIVVSTVIVAEVGPKAVSTALLSTGIAEGINIAGEII